MFRRFGSLPFLLPGCALGLLAAVGLLSALSCRPRPVTLGVLLPLTGEFAIYGRPMREGAELAAEAVNREGGVGGRRLDLRIRDTGGTPRGAADGALALIEQEQVPAIVAGGTSAEVLSAAPVAQRFGRVLLSPSASSPKLTDAGDWIFRNFPSDVLEGKVMADFAAFTLHASRVLVVASENPYSDGLRGEFCRAFESASRSTETLLFRSGQTRYGDLAAQVASRGDAIQALYLVGYTGELVPLVKALHAAGETRPLLTTSAVAGPEFARQLGAAAESTVFPRPAFDLADTQPPVAQFVAAYRARFGADPDIYAAHAYDAVRILAKVAGELGPRPDALRQGLLELRNYPGASGATTFDANGDVIQPYQLCVLLSGRVVSLQDVRQTALPPLQRRVETRRFGR